MAFGSNGGFLTGQLIEFPANAVPDGFLPCNGAAVSRTKYAALFNIIGTLWGEGDGSTTFNLPDFIDRFVKGSSTSGTFNNESLPNIKGGFGIVLSPNGNGCFSASSSGTDPRGGGGYPWGSVSMNASKSSAAYQDGAKVQPDNATVLICIKY